MNFELHPNFLNKDFIVDLPLSTVLLENESHYPWIILIPRRPNILKIMDLEMADQIQLLHELDICQKALWNSFKLTQLNVAAIGNKTPQLHIHVIGRKSTDPAWPNTVWDHPERLPYTPHQKETLIRLLQSALKGHR